jgi:hypothetical protein
MLSVEAGTNCPQGGDSGHGGRTVFRLSDDGSTTMSVRINGRRVKNVQTIEIVLGGDSEAETFIEALEFAARILRGQNGIYSGDKPEEEIQV